MSSDASQLPAGWRRLPTSTLAGYLSEFGEPYLTDDDFDTVSEELDARDHDRAEAASHHHDQLEDPWNETPFP